LLPDAALGRTVVGSLSDVNTPGSASPLASGKQSPLAAGAAPSQPIIEITDAAHDKIMSLRAEEDEADRLGLRLEIAGTSGDVFQYDLSFDEYTKAAFTDEVRTHQGLKVIIPAQDVDRLQGAVLDYADSTGLIIKNPNKPVAARIEGLVHDDELSAEIEGLVAGEINPALAAHGGFVSFVGHDGEGAAYLRMGGGCHGCSMSRMTMMDGVQTMLVEQIPAISRVVDVTDHSTGENPYYS
jgi:Fe/S biogenesis protein NfuA